MLLLMLGSFTFHLVVEGGAGSGVQVVTAAARDANCASSSSDYYCAPEWRTRRDCVEWNSLRFEQKADGAGGARKKGRKQLQHHFLVPAAAVPTIVMVNVRSSSIF